MNEHLFEEWETTVADVAITPLIPLPPKLPPQVNPCIDRFGPGPVGRICGDCAHLHRFRQSTTWYKCAKREWRTKGGKYPGTVYPGGDHRVRWPACAQFEPDQEEE